MSASLNSWYSIPFPSQPVNDLVCVDVCDDDTVPDNHFVVELESAMDPNVEKCRFESVNAESLALCSDGSYCCCGASEPMYADSTEFSAKVFSPALPNPWEWMPSDGAGMLQLTMHLTLIPAGSVVMPCDDTQPDIATDYTDPVNGASNPFPMVFSFPGVWDREQNKGKKIKVIWKKDI